MVLKLQVPIQDVVGGWLKVYVSRHEIRPIDFSLPFLLPSELQWRVPLRVGLYLRVHDVEYVDVGGFHELLVAADVIFVTFEWVHFSMLFVGQSFDSFVKGFFFGFKVVVWAAQMR